MPVTVYGTPAVPVAGSVAASVGAGLTTTVPVFSTAGPQPRTAMSMVHDPAFTQVAVEA